MNKCNKCAVKECETRDVLNKYKDPVLDYIVLKECNEYIPLEEVIT